MATIYLLRHGQTVWNEQGERFCGTSNVELTLHGIEQAKKAADHLKHISTLDAIFHSGLIRSKQTAQQILSVQENIGGSPRFQQIDAFKEVGFGDWEGLTKAEVHKRYGKLFESWEKVPATTAIPGGEDLYGAQARAFQKLQEIAINHQGQKIAIVAHNTINRLILMAILQAPIDNYRTIIQSNACINIIEYISDNRFKIHAVNLT